VKSTLARAAFAAILGAFCLSATLPAPAIAQTKAPMAKEAAKKQGPKKGVMAVQEALNRHGAKLKVDGYMGRKTRNALKKYQADNGLKATGKLDKATRAKLGV